MRRSLHGNQLLSYEKLIMCSHALTFIEGRVWASYHLYFNCGRLRLCVYLHLSICRTSGEIHRCANYGYHLSSYNHDASQPFPSSYIHLQPSLPSQVGHLAMETLLSLTSKRAGEWFKEELRVLGGVDHILRTIQDCVCRLRAPAASWGPADVDVLRKADRCMRVLENVSCLCIDKSKVRGEGG